VHNDRRSHVHDGCPTVCLPNRYEDLVECLVHDELARSAGQIVQDNFTIADGLMMTMHPTTDT
jgi:hypothetical protein